MEPKVPRPRGRPRKRSRPEEENESAAADTKSNNSKTKKRALETRSMALVGRYVLKEFGENVFVGKIVSYDSGLYRVDYEDGDFEDMESGELRELILEESYFDDDLSRRKVRLDDLVLSRILKESELEEEKKKVEVLKNEVDGVEISALSELNGGMTVENDGEQVEDDADSSSDSCEHARDRDLSLEAEVPLIPPLMLPPSSGTIGVPEEFVSHLFSVYGFLRSFSIILFLSPFGLDDFVGSLNCYGPNPLSDAVHVALLRALSCHLETVSSEGSELAAKCLRCLDWSLLDTLTWPVYLVQYFMVMGYASGPEWKRFYEDVSKREYYSLPVSRKLMILQLLCDDVLEYVELRAEIDMREAMEVGTDPDAVAVDPPEKGPRRVHPRFSKTSACKEREAMEIITESCEVKSSSRTYSLGLRSTEGNAGVGADVDGNSDECRLCGMDGTLLCCDGCPSAYHSRCIGVMKMYIPEGPWYCPECAIDKMGPAITVNTSLRGAELFGVDIYGQVFLGTCNHLLVLNTSLDTESYLRYYNLNDIPKVLHVLSSSIQHKTLYFDICKTIIHYWNIPEKISSPLEMGGNVANIKEDVKFSTGSSLPSAKDSHKFLDSVDAENASSFCGSNVNNVGVSCPDTSVDAMNQTDPPGSLSNGETMGGKDHPPVKKLSVQICIDSAMSAASVSQQAASDVTHQSLVDRSSVIDHTSCASGNSSDSYGGSANGIYFQANMFCQSKVGSHVGFGRDARNSAIDYAYMGISFKPHAYVNHYSHGHFAATAAAKLAVLSSEESQVSEVNKSGSARKVTSTSNIFLQVKAFSSAASYFFWPSAEKKLLDVPRERCGWCHSCKAPASSRRGCMLNSAVSTATKSANKILIGLPPLKNGEGFLPTIATYILYIEESLRGLVAGSFLSPDHRKQWRRKMEEASTCNEIKALLLDLEENISVTALSVDWVKLVDDWLIESYVIQSTSSTAGLPQKHGPGGRRGRKQSVASEVTADDCNDKSFDWWRGGKLSTYVFQKAILPGSMVRKAARQGGVRKISGINYVDSEIPKRSRQLIWRAAVERSKNAAQLALQVRYLDLHVRWTDLVRPEHNTLDGKGTETEASVFRNAIICDKKTVKSKIQYGVSFGNQKHLPSRVMKNVINIEQTEDRKEKYWFLVTHIPLYLIKEYEEKMSNVVLPSVNKPFSELSKLQRRQLQASRRNIFAYLASKRDKSEKCYCASCQIDVLLRNAIKCGTCQGYCHQDCTLSSMHMNGKVECLIICKQCYHAKVLAQNEISTKSPTTPLPLQGRDCRSARGGTKDMHVKSSIPPMKPLASIRSMENSVRIRERSSDTKQSASLSGLATKRSKLCNWGVIRRKKNSDETGIDFRCANILTRGGSNNHFLKPICELCEQPYNSDLMYIHCETCRKWYHAEAVELEESRISDVVGFKCCKCRRIRGPECPFMDPELREQKRKKRFGKPQKQGQGSVTLDSDFGTISNFKECKPITPIISTEDELVSANDPLLFSLSKVEQITEVDVELNTASGTGPLKLPVRRHVKREGEVDGFAGGDLAHVKHVELSTCPEPNDFVGPKEDSSLTFAQWDVSGNGLEGELLFDYESLNYEDMEFEPQTYFSFTELLASDDGGQVDGNDATVDSSGNWEKTSCSISQDGIDTFNNQVEPMDSDVNALHCHVCLHNEPAPQLHCDICGFLMHSHCSPWDESSSSSSEANWRCGRCREWR